MTTAEVPVVAPKAVVVRKRLDWQILLGLALTFGWLALGAIYIDQQIGWGDIAKQPADVIGAFLEGAFAPLAFLWLVIGYFLQQKALSQNTDALRMQFQEIQRSAEQAVRRTETIAASERHARQETFMRIADQIKRQLGGISGLLFISSQGSAGSGRISDEEMARYWSELNRGDPEVFTRLMLTTHLSESDEAERFALFYGTVIRARHSNNFIFTFERLRQRAKDADSDGMLEDTITGSAHGFLYRLAITHRQHAPPELADVEITGRDFRAMQPVPEVQEAETNRSAMGSLER
ncbi:MAG: hypothetical protein JJT88_08180 [Gammaproteobacteria bacterium]|nr:hypothetical protein [Gammaproteobacteria bacterium]